MPRVRNAKQTSHSIFRSGQRQVRNTGAPPNGRVGNHASTDQYRKESQRCESRQVEVSPPFASEMSPPETPSSFAHNLLQLAMKFKKPVALVVMGVIRIPLFALPAHSPLAETVVPPDGFTSGSFAYEDSSGDSNRKPFAEAKTDIVVPAPNPHSVHGGLDVPNRIPTERDPVIVPERLSPPIVPIFPNPPKVDEIDTRPDSTRLPTNRPIMIVPER